ncbi:MAG: hypothetical protein BM557_01225 [Flavobacterium sp. MedPE-SWcel]|uniref:hypothetical protein n=1 Tax=uncultured Flavobacterium sp. TaxID=165435 RepID=UPI00091D2666|nr:hypothetical protein [uncultured Flavobacterium sp.]OIQ22029.1 MAG: hypothetical protein BM557_01225 [Flavobacterium sp. MedPE-SWcel]
MDQYLICFYEKTIISVTEIEDEGCMLGKHNDHEILPLTEAIVKFNNDGFDVSLLVKVFEKPEEEEETTYI